MKTTFQKRPGENGFTLIELMIVVGLVGLIAAMATASFTNWTTKASFNDQKASLYDALTRSRNMANSRNECVRLMIDGQSIHISAYGFGSNGTCTPLGSKTIDIPDTVFKSGFTVEPFNGTSPTLVFNQQGGVEGGATAKVYLNDQKGTRAGFMIYPALGQIRQTN